MTYDHNTDPAVIAFRAARDARHAKLMAEAMAEYAAVLAVSSVRKLVSKTLYAPQVNA